MSGKSICFITLVFLLSLFLKAEIVSAGTSASPLPGTYSKRLFLSKSRVKFSPANGSTRKWDSFLEDASPTSTSTSTATATSTSTATATSTSTATATRTSTATTTSTNTLTATASRPPGSTSTPQLPTRTSTPIKYNTYTPVDPTGTSTVQTNISPTPFEPSPTSTLEERSDQSKPIPSQRIMATDTKVSPPLSPLDPGGGETHLKEPVPVTILGILGLGGIIVILLAGVLILVMLRIQRGQDS